MTEDHFSAGRFITVWVNFSRYNPSYTFKKFEINHSSRIWILIMIYGLIFLLFISVLSSKYHSRLCNDSELEKHIMLKKEGFYKFQPEVLLVTRSVNAEYIFTRKRLLLSLPLTLPCIRVSIQPVSENVAIYRNITLKSPWKSYT